MTAAPRIGITIDCADPAVVAAFWERFLGYTVRPHPPGAAYVTLERPAEASGLSHVTFQQVPEPKTTKARAHLDLFVDHGRPLVDEMSAAGAQPVSTTEAGAWTTRVLLDPAGNEFCVIGPD
jgi:hypothetical protein